MTSRIDCACVQYCVLARIDRVYQVVVHLVALFADRTSQEISLHCAGKTQIS